MHYFYFARDSSTYDPMEFNAIALPERVNDILEEQIFAREMHRLSIIVMMPQTITKGASDLSLREPLAIARLTTWPSAIDGKRSRMYSRSIPADG